jgi:type I restriction enzyme R subunit
MYESPKEKALRLDELSTVEQPFLDQLREMDWDVNSLNDANQVNNPSDSFRKSLKEFILKEKLIESLEKINPFLKGQTDQLEQVIRKITVDLPNDLLQANEQVLELLINNTKVSENRTDKTANPVVKYIDFENIANNSFIAISQFKIAIPGSDAHFKPDIMLFVNGLPIGIVECKSTKVEEPIEDAIDQMLRYANLRGTSEVEGNQRMFFYNQIMIATCRNEARFGSITCKSKKHYYPWFDPYPYTINQIPSSLKTAPHNQNRLIYGMLSKKNLLEIIQSFIVFSTDTEGKKIKIVCRWQQYRAVQEVMSRLKNMPTPKERGGIIWHTQGSGKSLTMMYLVRAMYKEDDLKKWKIVFVTDRTQLEKQLSETSQSIGFEVKVADSIDKLKTLLKNNSSDLVMAMIHKFQERDRQILGVENEGSDDKLQTTAESLKLFDVLNTSENVLVMIDEAHRSQYKIMGANLERALPNATRLAFTGTPIDKTDKTFQYYIHKYTLNDARRDEVIVDIVYEGRTQNPEIKDKQGMNAKFVDVFNDRTPNEWQQIMGFYSRRAYLEAFEIINDKAIDMVDHYTTHVLPNGFKAQVVCVSKEAAVRYKNALELAITAKIKWYEGNKPEWKFLPRLKALKVGVVFSGTHNDLPHIKKYSADQSLKTQFEESFKLPFESEDKEKGIKGDVGLLVVVDMLLTGFDAPIEQVMYLDKVIVAHNLLQAIARVNRLYVYKTSGFVIDYVGVGHHLKEALDYFKNKEDLDEVLGALKENQENYDKLVHAHKDVWELLKENGIEELDDIDAIFDVFYDEKIRFDFLLKYRVFASYLDKVYPSAKALDYEPDFRRFSAVCELAKKHFRDGRMSMKGIPAKLRAIVDEYLTSTGIETKVKAISILSDDFGKEVGKRNRIKTKAAEVEHAIRHYVNVNIDIDPELMSSFAEMMEAIFAEFKDNWQLIYEELEKLRRKIKETMEEEESYGLDRKREIPFFHSLKKELFGDIHSKISDDETADLISLTQDVSRIIVREIQLPDFWDKPGAKNKLRQFLIDEFLEFGANKKDNMGRLIIQKHQSLAQRLLELAEKKHHTLLRND